LSLFFLEYRLICLSWIYHNLCWSWYWWLLNKNAFSHFWKIIRIHDDLFSESVYRKFRHWLCKYQFSCLLVIFSVCQTKFQKCCECDHKHIQYEMCFWINSLLWNSLLNWMWLNELINLSQNYDLVISCLSILIYIQLS